MTISITDGTTTVALPADLYWSDEETYAPVQQTVQRTLTGALIVSAAALLAGRPITLQPADERSAWMTFDVLQQLRNWGTEPLLQLQITLRGVTRAVIFRHQDGAIDAQPVVHYSDVQNGDFYSVTLRFMEIE